MLVQRLPWQAMGFPTLPERIRLGRSDVTWFSARVAALLIAAIRVYQWTLAPLLGNCCRFEPSCSRYTLLCIERWGPVRGSWLGLRRLSRCHPFCPGGHDPPPEMTI